MNILSRSCWFLCIAAVLGMVGCNSVAVRQTLAPDRLSFSMPGGAEFMDQWKVGSQAEQPPAWSIIEWVPSDETIEDWSQLFTVQDFGRELRDNMGPLSGIVEGLKQAREEPCRSVTTWTVLAEDPNSVLYEWTMPACGTETAQHEIARFIDGRWNRFRLAYTARVEQIDPEVRQIWIDSLTSATVTQ